MDLEPSEIPFNEMCLAEDWKERFPEMGSLVDSPSIYMIRIVQIWQRRIKEKLVNFDLTVTQCIMLASLMLISGKDKHVTQADLASFMSADKMMVSEVLRTLEKKGYVARKHHPTDRRAKSLEVTPRGMEIIDVAVKAAMSMDKEFFSVIEDDREAFVRIMDKLLTPP